MVCASTSAASPANAIYDSKDSPTMGKVSDVVKDDTTVVDNDTIDGNKYESNNANKTLEAVFFCAARDIMS
jgi:hypothetical protein